MTDANEVKKERRGDLPFAYNEIVRLMKENLDNDKMIKEQVKIETQLGILINEKTVLDGLVDTIKLIAENNNQTQDVLAMD